MKELERNGASVAPGGSHTVSYCMAAQLSVKDDVGEVLLSGRDAEVVVPDAVPLAVEEADESDDEEERQADPETGEADYLQSVKLGFRGLYRQTHVVLNP